MDEHKPIFKLAPAEDIVGKILSARDNIVYNKKLTFGARLLGVLILDLSVRSASRDTRLGVVTISQPALGNCLGVSPRTIYNWKVELIEAGIVWMTRKSRPNSWPLDTYHIAEIDRPSHPLGNRTSQEGYWGTEQPRVHGNQLPQEKNCKNGNSEKENPPVSEEIATVAGSQLPAWPEASFRRGKKLASGVAGSQLLATQEASCEPPRKPVASHAGSQLLATPENSCYLKEAKEGVSAVSEGGEPPPPDDKAFENWKASLPGQYPSRLRALESKIKARLNTTRSEAAKSGLRRQLKAVQDLLLPPVADDPTPASAPAEPKVEKPRMPLDQARAAFAKAKAESGL